MVQKASNNELDVNKPAYMYYLMTKSGQCSPTSDTLDSGTGSDLETSPSHNSNSNSSSPSLTSAVAKSIRKFSDLSMQLPNGQQHRFKNRSSDTYNTDSEESESSLSCDSLNSNEILRLKCNGNDVALVNMQPPPPSIESKSSSKTLINTSLFMIATRPPVAPPLPPVSPPPLSSSNDNRHIFTSDENNITKINFLPHSLLRDIRDRSMAMSKTTNAVAIETTPQQNDHNDNDGINQLTNHKIIIENTEHFNKTNNNINQAFSRCHNSNSSNNQTSECQQSVTASSTARIQATRNNGNGSASSVQSSTTKTYENDKYYKFHINECVPDETVNAIKAAQQFIRDDDTFAGYKDISARVPASPIRSSKGTIRGVKNRVRNGIATFLQMQQTNVKVIPRAQYGFTNSIRSQH